MGEILSGYTLEVDYITPETAASLLAASTDYDVYTDLTDHVLSGAPATVLTSIVLAALREAGYNISWITFIASEVVALACDLGWSYLRNIEASRMYNCLNKMAPSDLMKIEYAYSSTAGVVSRIYSVYHPSYYYSNGVYSYYNIPNPFPGKYGFWYEDECAYLYAAY